jgi:multiple sugar transport system substrate-binding protein
MAHPTQRRMRAFALLAAVAIAGTACSSDDGGTAGTDGAETASLRYALWDANQQPAYQQCTDMYMEENTDVTVTLEQTGWDDYWTGLQTAMVAGDAPDIFTNYIGQVPEFLDKNLLVDIAPLIERDEVDLSIYRSGVELWQRDDQQFGLPKDWDTVAMVYNQDMLDAAGVTVDELNAATWNPDDGGTFEEIIARLTLDADGNDGLSPDFDADNVVQYGLIPHGVGGGIGNQHWSWLAVPNGFDFQPEPWSNEYNYDAPELVETFEWLRSLWTEKGYAPPFADQESLGANALFLAGEGALVADGSWMINSYVDAADVNAGFARLPEGPQGRKSATNSLADSIWTGSENQEAAWEFVQFLASAECLDIVGESGVVFPSTDSGTDKVLELRQSQGVDVSAFTDQSADPEGTFLNPIGDSFAEVSSIMNDYEGRIFGGTGDIATLLEEANTAVLDAAGG